MIDFSGIRLDGPHDGDAQPGLHCGLRYLTFAALRSESIESSVRH